MEVKVKTHIGSYGIVISNDRIVLIKKSRGGYTGKLDLPGGKIEHEESPMEALRRELNEEANLNVDKYKLFDVCDTNIKWQMNEVLWEDLHHIGILYLVMYNNEEIKYTADGLDSNGADFYDIENLKKEELTPFAIYALEKLGYELK